MLAQIREKERRLKVQNDAILRDLKQEKNEVTDHKLHYCLFLISKVENLTT